MKPLVAVLLLAVTIYALIDWARTPDSRMKAVPKPLWLVAILLLPLLGPIGWLVAGKTENPRRTTGHSPGVGPDDDPAFLRELEDEKWRRHRRQRQESDQSDTEEDSDDEPGDPEGPPTAGV